MAALRPSWCMSMSAPPTPSIISRTFRATAYRSSWLRAARRSPKKEASVRARARFTETGRFGPRTRPIHWAQEMFDQAGMVRELVKWDYELRVPAQVGDVVSRAVEVAMASPRGPVYLVLPREPLAAALPEPVGPTKPRPQAAAAYPDPRTIATLAEWIPAAERPLIVTSTLPVEAVHQLERLAERCAIPVVTHSPRSVCLP